MPYHDMSKEELIREIESLKQRLASLESPSNGHPDLSIKDKQLQLDLALDTTQAGLWTLDIPSGRFSADERTLAIFNVTRDVAELGVEEWKKVIHPDDLDNTVYELEYGITRGFYSHQYRIVLPNGLSRHIEARGFVSHDHKGDPKTLSGICMDVTSLARIRASLIDSEVKFRALFDQMIDAFALHEMIFDDKGRPVDYVFLDVNPAFERMTGLKRVDVLGKRVREVMPGTEDYWISMYGKVVRSGEPVYFENYSSQLQRHYEGVAYRNSPTQFVVIFTDVTQRKLAEEALRVSEARFRVLFEDAPIPYQSLDKDGTLLDVNQTWLETLGYQKEEVIGRWFGDFIAPEDTDLFKARFPGFLTKGETHDAEFKLKKKDGSVILGNFDGKVVYNPDGSPLRTHCIFQDIMKRRQAEKELRESEYYLRMSAQAAKYAIYQVDLETKTVFWSPELREIIGVGDDYKMPEANQFPEFIHPEDKDQVKKVFEEAFGPSGDGHFNNEHRIVRPDGSVRWVNIRGKTEFAGEGKVRRPARFSGISMDITERKLMELEKEEAISSLRQSEARYRSLIDSIAGGIYELDANGRVVYVNQMVLSVFGYTFDEVKGRSIVDLISPDYRGDIHARLMSIFKGERTHGTTYLLDKNGRSYPVMYTAVPLRDGHAIKGVIGMFIDISEQVNAERKIHEQYAFLQMLMDTIPYPVFYMNRQGIYLGGNKSYLDWLGLTAERFIGATVFDVFDKETAEAFSRKDAELFADPGVQMYEASIPLKNGDVRDVRFYKATFTDVNGEVAGSIGTIIDITEQKERERLVRESEQKYSAVVENIGVGVVVTDPQKNILFVNGLIRKWFGGDTALIGKPCYEALWGLTEESACGHCPGHDPVLDGRQHEGRIRRKIGDKDIDLRVLATPIKDEQGHVTAVAQMFDDITSEIEFQQTLIRGKEAAEEVAKSKTQFLANMSHEIRTPLNAIIGFSDLLSKTPLNDKQKKFVNTTLFSGKILMELIDNILDFARFSSGMTEIEEVEFDLPILIRDVFQVVATRIDPQRVVTYIRIGENVPDHIKCDAKRLRQILLNLLGNASKYTSQGEIGIIVKQEGEPLPGDADIHLQITVKDTGIGIPADKMHELFMPFKQLDDSITKKFGGTGLGLSICKILADAMRGKITVRSEAGKGSEFTLGLPVKRSTGKFIARGDRPNALGGRYHVVIAADNAVSADLISHSCSFLNLPYTVINPCTEEGCREAVDLFAGDSPPAAFVIEGAGFQDDEASAIAKVRSLCGPQKPFTMMISSATYEVKFRQAPEDRFDVYIPRPLSVKDCLKGFARMIEVCRVKEMNMPRPTRSESEKNVKILVVEDNEFSRDLIKEVLLEINVSADYAPNGREAIELLYKHKYALCLMDVMMPVMDGYDTTRLIRKDITQDMPIIALTAAAMEKDRQQCLEVGMNDFLTKPVNIEVLKNKILATLKKGQDL